MMPPAAMRQRPMAKFTDQFDRHPPNHSHPRIAIPTWPTLIRNEALILLSGFDDWMLIEIGLALEEHIATAAQPYNFPVSKDALIWTRIQPHWVSPTFAPKSSDEIRDTFGDLNIFLCQCEAPDEWELECKLAFGPKVERWHFLAVLALWKLFDSGDVMFGRTAHTINGMIPENRDLRFQNAAGIAMEAQAACQIAIQLQERAGHVLNAAMAQAEIEGLKRSKQASKAGVTRHAPNTAKRKVAMELATQKPFASRAAAARHVIENLEKRQLPGKPVEYYTFGPVDQWLKEDGWKSI